ncbi:MAG: hypothetical protein R2939_07820 [Kofleriaceae bacterium]
MDPLDGAAARCLEPRPRRRALGEQPRPRVVADDLVDADRERRPLEQPRRILEGHHQPARPCPDHRPTVRGVARPHRRGQRDQRGAVVERVGAAEQLAGDREHVADDDRDRAGRQRPQLTVRELGRGDALLGEERARRDLGQLDADHLVAAAGQEREVDGLAAQRHQHPPPGAELVDEALEQRVGAPLVEADLARLPALEPERRVHRRSLARIAAATSPAGGLAPRRSDGLVGPMKDATRTPPTTPVEAGADRLQAAVELDPIRRHLAAAARLALTRGVAVDDFMRAAWTTLMDADPGLRARLEAESLLAQLAELRLRGQVGQA